MSFRSLSKRDELSVDRVNDARVRALGQCYAVACTLHVIRRVYNNIIPERALSGVHVVFVFVQQTNDTINVPTRRKQKESELLKGTRVSSEIPAGCSSWVPARKGNTITTTSRMRNMNLYDNNHHNNAIFVE